MPRKALRGLVPSLLLVALPTATSAVAQPTSSSTYSPFPERPLAPPKSRPIKVALLISQNTTLIDIAGPLQTFGQVRARAPAGFVAGPDNLEVQPDGTYFPFQTYTVSETRTPIHAGATAQAHLTITPDYTFEDAPEPDIVVVGAQSGKDENYLGYLRRMANDGKLVLSVCTGVGQIAQAGLLDGRYATSHHDFISQFQQRYPKIHWVADKAYVHSAPMIYTAGGETSGFELALHIVELYFGRDAAVATARSMEYRGPAWQKI